GRACRPRDRCMAMAESAIVELRPQDFGAGAPAGRRSRPAAAKTLPRTVHGRDISLSSKSCRCGPARRVSRRPPSAPEGDAQLARELRQQAGAAPRQMQAQVVAVPARPQEELAE